MNVATTEFNLNSITESNSIGLSLADPPNPEVEPPNCESMRLPQNPSRLDNSIQLHRAVSSRTLQLRSRNNQFRMNVATTEFHLNSITASNSIGLSLADPPIPL